MAVCGRGGVAFTDLCCAEAAEEAVRLLKIGEKDLPDIFYSIFGVFPV